MDLMLEVFMYIMLFNYVKLCILIKILYDGTNYDGLTYWFSVDMFEMRSYSIL